MGACAGGCGELRDDAGAVAGCATGALGAGAEGVVVVCEGVRGWVCVVVGCWRGGAWDGGEGSA